ncbi:MAG: hypothetical protein EOP48_00835 [Sphingobacteriales bacterium]|nr:MAG: hypothetical protein EOP48_00835 [Sphingobacteriales bacterium]
MANADVHNQMFTLSTNKELLDEILLNPNDAPIKIQTSSNQIMPLNTILYGPPGTGKTYNSINKAIKIANPDFNFANKTRTDVKKEYERLLNDKKIAFCTFHQSMSYEDFIEGIKPVISNVDVKDRSNESPDGSSLQYMIEDGIFKMMCNNSRFQPTPATESFSVAESEFADASFYKMSLGSTQTPDDDEIYRYCIDNGYISLGWGDEYDYSGMSEREVGQATKDYGLNDFESRAIKAFIHDISIDNYVVISFGNYFFRAIGKVEGEYEFKDDSPIRYHHFRKVRWLLTDVQIPVSQIYDRNFSQQSIYKLNTGLIKKDFFVKDGGQKGKRSANQKYVLIIDEINRGNVSQIFGELITLIEDDKREGKPESISAILPYSKQVFTVPDNLYIVGTMNTADKSVEALDAALRRRFSFEEMMPDYGVLEKDGKDLVIEGINIKTLLKRINERINYLLDGDHQIGHSYFCNVSSADNLKLAFKNKIIPLLREYFYNDHEKILWILGSGFMTAEENAPTFAWRDATDFGKTSYHFKAIDSQFNIINALKQTLGEGS